MSQRALLLAVKAEIQSLLGVGDETCDVMFDGRPKPAAGQEFYAIHPGEWAGEDTDAGLKEYFGVDITCTRRLGYAPMDQWGAEVLMKASEGLDAMLGKVRARMHMNYTIQQEANNLINADGVANGFVEVLRFRSGGRPEPREAEWFGATESSPPAGGRYAHAGISQTLTFDRAMRIQRVESQT